MTDMPINTKVECTDGPCGKSTQIIIDTEKFTVIYYVVKDKKLPVYPDRLVPFKKVKHTTRELIQLNCTKAEVEKMEPFTTQRLEKEEIPDYGDAYLTGDPKAFVDPVLDSDSWVESVPQINMPHNGAAIHSGMPIMTDKHKVGKVDELLVDTDSGKITHLVMREGHLWGVKDIAIPTTDIDIIGGDAIYLKIDKDAVGALPVIP